VLDVAAIAARHRLAATRLDPVDLADLRAIGLPAIVEVQEPGGGGRIWRWRSSAMRRGWPRRRGGGPGDPEQLRGLLDARGVDHLAQH
jgi:hypothetical protein